MTPRRSRRNTREPPPEESRSWWPRRGRRADQHEEPARQANGDRRVASEQERVIIEALADLRDMDVREVMTPRLDVTALEIPVTVEDVARAVRESGHSSFPVVEGDLDRLVGVLFVTDLFRSRQPSGNEPLPELSPIDVSRRIRPAHVVPESKGVLETLAEMRAARRAFAVVVDEHGGVAGVLTLKDLLEPLVGDLHDELDREEPDIVPVDAHRWLVDGRTSVDDVRERLGIEVPEGEYVTLGGYLCDALDHIPEEGEELMTQAGWRFRVVERDKLRVAKVVVTDGGPGPAPESSATTPTASPAEAVSPGRETDASSRARPADASSPASPPPAPSPANAADASDSSVSPGLTSRQNGAG